MPAFLVAEQTMGVTLRPRPTTERLASTGLPETARLMAEEAWACIVLGSEAAERAEVAGRVWGPAAVRGEPVAERQ